MQKTEKQKWKEMDWKQRLGYFKDYYLLSTVIILAAAAVVIFLSWHFLKPKVENLMYVGLVDETLDEQKKSALTAELEQILSADGASGKVVFDDMFYMKDDGLSKLQVYLSNGQMDAVIVGEETFKALAAYGFFEPLDEGGVSKALLSYEDRFYYTEGYKDTEEISFDDHETGQGEVKAYGIRLTDSGRYQEMATYVKDPVMGIVVDGEHPEYIEALLKILLASDSSR